MLITIAGKKFIVSLFFIGMCLLKPTGIQFLIMVRCVYYNLDSVLSVGTNMDIGRPKKRKILVLQYIDVHLLYRQCFFRPPEYRSIKNVFRVRFLPTSDNKSNLIDRLEFTQVQV
jgi:hypothetical protein